MKKINYDKFGKGLAKTGNYISANKKPLLYIGGAIAVVVIGYAIVKRLKGEISGKKEKGGKFIEQGVDLSKTSITPQIAKNYAESFYSAFNNYWGTDNGLIENIFSKINSEDFKLIYNYYGIRSRDIDGKAPTGLWKLFGQYDDLNLVEWLNEELGVLDFSLKNKIRPIVNGAGFVLEK